MPAVSSSQPLKHIKVSVGTQRRLRNRNLNTRVSLDNMKRQACGPRRNRNGKGNVQHFVSFRQVGIASRRAVACSAGVQKLTTQELEVAISSREKTMVIDFFATWCGPCVMLSKVLEQLAAEMGDEVQFVKIDTDEEVELASYFRFKGFLPSCSSAKTKGAKC